MDDIKTIPIPKEEVVSVSLKSTKPKVKQPVYKSEKVELPSNIKNYDDKIKEQAKNNPYSYNSISLDKRKNDMPTAAQLVVNPTYNIVAKMFGVDTIREWNRYYDKIYSIVEWAQGETKSNSADRIIKHLASVQNTVPSMGARRVDDIYIYTKLQTKK